MDDENLKFRVMQRSDLTRVLKFYIENFYRYEPVFSSTPQLVPGCCDLLDMAKCICGGTSILCYRHTADDEEEIIGGVLAMGKNRLYFDELLQAASDLSHSKYGHYLQMLGVIHRKADICNRYGVNKIFFTFMACVEPNSRGRNICKRLAEESMALAKNLGFTVYTTDCTSNYTALICEHLKMDRLNTLRYTDFVD